MTTSKPSKPKSKVQQIASSISSTTKVSAHDRQGTKGVTEHQRKKTQGQKDAELADRLLKSESTESRPVQQVDLKKHRKKSSEVYLTTMFCLKNMGYSREEARSKADERVKRDYFSKKSKGEENP